jgi:hypothetical protein
VILRFPVMIAVRKGDVCSARISGSTKVCIIDLLLCQRRFGHVRSVLEKSRCGVCTGHRNRELILEFRYSIGRLDLSGSRRNRLRARSGNL